jgi:hypothetical protein
MSDADRAQATLNVGQLSLDVRLRSQRWRCIRIGEHQRPLLSDKREPEVKRCIQHKVVRAMVECRPYEDFVRDMRVRPRQASAGIGQGCTFGLHRQ